ncbi:unnamed protein product, partial [Allacma fusca]
MTSAASYSLEEDFMETPMNDTSNEVTRPDFIQSPAQTSNDTFNANESFDREKMGNNSNVISSQRGEYLKARSSTVIRRRRRARVDSRRNEVLQHQSTLPYTILSADDYGTVACWARNS